MKNTRAIVRRWQMDDLVPALELVGSGRSLSAGQTAFRETGCVQCHRFGGEGGNVGPDLTGVGKRVAANALLESILLPSKVIAEEYATHAFETDDGRVVTGRIEREDDRTVVVRPMGDAEPLREIAKDQIVERRRLDRSNMPAGIVDVLEKEQVLDLLAYLLTAPAPPAAAP
jgi:putative heme-binding domain-containing protein